MSPQLNPSKAASPEADSNSAKRQEYRDAKRRTIYYRLEYPGDKIIDRNITIMLNHISAFDVDTQIEEYRELLKGILRPDLEQQALRRLVAAARASGGYRLQAETGLFVLERADAPYTVQPYWWCRKEKRRIVDKFTQRDAAEMLKASKSFLKPDETERADRALVKFATEHFKIGAPLRETLGLTWIPRESRPVVLAR